MVIENLRLFSTIENKTLLRRGGILGVLHLSTTINNIPIRICSVSVNVSVSVRVNVVVSVRVRVGVSISVRVRVSVSISVRVSPSVSVSIFVRVSLSLRVFLLMRIYTNTTTNRGTKFNNGIKKVINLRTKMSPRGQKRVKAITYMWNVIISA